MRRKSKISLSFLALSDKVLVSTNSNTEDACFKLCRYKVRWQGCQQYTIEDHRRGHRCRDPQTAQRIDMQGYLVVEVSEPFTICGVAHRRQGRQATSVVLNEHVGMAKSGGEGAYRKIVVDLRESYTFDRCLAMPIK